MVTLGYILSSEEKAPSDLVQLAARAEQAGFEIGLISDHYHPWTESQGESPFVWAVIGAIGQATSRFRVGTGVTCPIIRMHPAIVSQAAATCEALMPGRFFLGLGTGEKLNEHIIGERWPPIAVRAAMLDEAVEVIRELWTGEEVSHHGEYFCVEDARLYSLPENPPPLFLAASGPQSAKRAGELGDGLISTTPDGELVRTFTETGNRGRRLARLSVCYAASEAVAVDTALRYWPNGAVHGSFMLDLAMPRDVEAVAELVTGESISGSIICGPDPEKHVARIRQYADAGYDEICVHQVGPDQESFFEFYEREVLPQFQTAAAASGRRDGPGGTTDGNS